jgi:hypothetical protein
MKQAFERNLASNAQRLARVTKKNQIIELFTSGETDIARIAKITDANASYVSSVLQNAGLMTGYFDLYTTTANPMNVYSRRFVNKLGFRDEATARRSVEELESAYREFDLRKDRAGQHHALEMALVMFNRARWTNKLREAAIFRDWLISRLNISEPQTQAEATLF